LEEKKNWQKKKNQLKNCWESIELMEKSYQMAAKYLPISSASRMKQRQPLLLHHQKKLFCFDNSRVITMLFHNLQQRDENI
jgi:hypothetical protein